MNMRIQANAALILIDQQQGILHPRLGPRNNLCGGDRADGRQPRV
ncbi:hypothetical protein [Pseudomonas sp. MWU13-2105]